MNDHFVLRLVQMFMNAGRVGDALGEACRLGAVDIINELLSKEVNANSVNSHGTPMISLAASGGQVEAIKCLLQHKADTNAIARFKARCQFKGT